MNKKLLVLFLLFLATKTFSVEVSAPRFPIFVQSEDRVTANTTVRYCNEYMQFLQKRLNVVKITPITVFAGSRDYFFYKHSLTSKIYINKNSSDRKDRLTERIAISLVEDIILNKQDDLYATKVPLFVPIGIAGIYLKSKIDPSFEKIHRKLLDDKWIPLQRLITTTDYPKNNERKYFVLESIYFMEYFLYNSKGDAIRNFLLKYADNSDLALIFLTKNLGFDGLENLESSFHKKIRSKTVVYNIISSLPSSLRKQSTPQTLKKIMTFEYTYPKTGEKIIVKGDKIKIDDLPYISGSDIEAKIIRLRMIKDSGMSSDAIKIGYYIKALRYLKQGDYEKYYDNYYMAR